MLLRINSGGRQGRPQINETMGTFAAFRAFGMQLSELNSEKGNVLS